MGFDQMTPRTHGPMCEFIDEILEKMMPGGKQQKGMILIPRVCFKTSIGSIALPPYYIEKYNISGRVLLDSHGHELSKQILDEIKGRIEMPEFVDVFGSWRSPTLQWSEEGIICARRVTPHKEPTIDTAGIDKAKTGGHYDLIIPDDLHTEKNALGETDTPILKVRRHIQTLSPLLEPGGGQLILGTRWAHNDAYGWIIHKDEDRIKKGKDPEYVKFIRGAYNADGSLFFPEKLNEEFLEEQRAILEDRLYSVWYLNEPIEEASKVFQRAHLQFRKFSYEVAWNPQLRLEKPEAVPWSKDREFLIPVYVTMAIDPAVTDKKRSDFTGITVVGHDPAGRWWIIHSEPFKGLPDQVIERIVYLSRIYQPRIISLETISSGHVYRDYLLAKFRELELHIPLYEYKAGGGVKKSARIQSMQPMFKNHKVFIGAGQEELIRQLVEFPQLEHDDVIDSLVQHRDIGRPSDPAAMAPFLEEEEAFDEPERNTRKRDGTHVGLSSLRK